MITKKQKADRETRKLWIADNPPDEFGYWDCYLRISKMCLLRVDEQTLTIEHVIAKSRSFEQRHNQKNLRPSCVFCNGLKGSRSLINLVMEYPHLSQYID